MQICRSNCAHLPNVGTFKRKYFDGEIFEVINNRKYGNTVHVLRLTAVKVHLFTETQLSILNLLLINKIQRHVI